MIPQDHTSTFVFIYGLYLKHSGGKYQYVPAPYDVNIILVSFSLIILHRPKSDNLTIPSLNKIFWGFRS